MASREVVGVGIGGERLAAWLGIASGGGAASGASGGADRRRGAFRRDAAALGALERDKKIVAGRLRLPLVPEIGRFEIVEDVDLDLVRRALRSVLA